MIVGRNEKENKFLEAATQDGDYLLMPEEDIAGPVSLGIGDFNKERLTFAASIACRYFDLTSKEAKVVFRRFP